MNLTVTGEISNRQYDRVIDIDRIEFTDKTKKLDCYVEIPRLDSLISIENSKSLSVTISDEENALAKIKDPTMVLNTTLYMVRKSGDKSSENIYQFSAGGIILRFMTKEQLPFKLRGNKVFKLILKAS